MLIRPFRRTFIIFLSSLLSPFCRVFTIFCHLFALFVIVTLLLIVLGICQRFVIWSLEICYDLGFEDLGLGFGIWDLGFYNQRFEILTLGFDLGFAHLR